MEEAVCAPSQRDPWAQHIRSGPEGARGVLGFGALSFPHSADQLLVPLRGGFCMNSVCVLLILGFFTGDNVRLDMTWRDVQKSVFTYTLVPFTVIRRTSGS